VRVTYHEQERGEYTNVYLDKLKLLEERSPRTSSRAGTRMRPDGEDDRSGR
jgi:hypothetical protein